MTMVLERLRGKVSFEEQGRDFKSAIAFLCGYHPRCGALSSLCKLPRICAERAVGMLGLIPTSLAWVVYLDENNEKCLVHYKNLHTQLTQYSSPFFVCDTAPIIATDVFMTDFSCTSLNPIHIVFVGDPFVGKTAILYSYAYNAFPMDYVQTTFDSFSVNVMIDGIRFHLSISDTSGLKEVDEFRVNRYKCADCVAICYNCLDIETLENCYDFWFKEIKEHCPNVPRLLVGMKKDMLCTTDASHKYVHGAPVEEMTRKLGCRFATTCSARTQEGILYTFQQLTRVARGKIP
ncbi:Rac1, RHO family GTPase [Pelomyxa schiedti]|nr:Rac1, RHO family GTPase [Pelomyxa schiedti]